MARQQLNDEVAVCNRYRSRDYNHPSVRLAVQFLDRMLDLLSADCAGCAHLQTKHSSRRLNGGQASNLWYSLLRTVDDRDAGDTWSDPLEYLRHLAAHGEFAERETRDVAAGLGKASNETASDRIGNTQKHNRNSAC